MIASTIPDRGLFLAHLDEIGIGVEDLTPDFLLIGFELSLELLNALIYPGVSLVLAAASADRRKVGDARSQRRKT